jgi:hypothetical protein
MPGLRTYMRGKEMSMPKMSKLDETVAKGGREERETGGGGLDDEIIPGEVPTAATRLPVTEYPVMCRCPMSRRGGSYSSAGIVANQHYYNLCLNYYCKASYSV